MIFQLIYKISKTLPNYCCGTHIITPDKTPPCNLFGILDIPVSRVVLLFMTDAVAYHPDLPFRIEAFIFSASKCNDNWHFTAEFHSGNRQSPLLKGLPMPKWMSHFQNWSFWRYKHLVFFSPPQFGLSLNHLSHRAASGIGRLLQLHHCSTSMDSALLPSFPSSLLGIAPGNVLHCTSCMHTNICLRICLPRSQRHT